MALKKTTGMWVSGEAFFDREFELDRLAARVRNGTHTLLTAQRRMGKTSLVRELFRRLDDEGSFETVFVDLEAAANRGRCRGRNRRPDRIGARRLDATQDRHGQPGTGHPR